MKDYSELKGFADLTRKNCLYCIADLGVTKETAPVRNRRALCAAQHLHE